eukprot:scaffold7852_cov151-Skeletonema_menzelii.AAC.5
METNDVVDFDSQVVQEDENVPLTPPGPEMRKILEGGVVTAAADVGSVEEGEEKEEIDMGEGMNLGDNNYLKEDAKEEEEVEAQGNEVVDQDSNDDIAPAIIPAVLSSSDHPIAVYEDEENVDNDDDVIAPPPDDEAVNISSGWESSEGETSSEEEETESSAEEHTDESNDDDEEEDAAPYVAAAAGGAAAAAASAKEEEKNVEMGSNEPTETDAAGDNPPESSPEDDFVTPEDEETGEQFNLANEESRNQVLPPQDDNDDEEQQLTLAAAGTLAVTENSVENDDPSFASAAVATKAADTVTNDDEEHRVSRKSSSCCKRHKCLTLFIILMILFVIAAVVLIILFLIGPLKHPVSQEESPLKNKGTATGLCTVVDLGPFYQTDCETCRHTVAMDAETGLIARGGGGGGTAAEDDDSIHFIVNDGTYIPGQTLPFTTHEVSALLGNYAALGDPDAFGRGTVYVYEKDIAGAWSDVWNMSPDKLGAKFGTAIALDADKMVVGAPGDVNESSTGSVYVYGRGGDGNWVEEGKLYQTSVPTGNFGSGVALQGDTLVVADATFPGTVYVYQYDSTANSWDQLINGTLSSADCSSTFGVSVGVTNSGGVLVECPKEKGGEGAVYYYTPTSDGSGYELRQKITAFNEEPLPELGKKIVVDKGRLLVTTAAESVYVYQLGDGTFTEWGGGEWEEAALIAAPGGANDAALSGEHIFLSYGGNTHSYILEC